MIFIHITFKRLIMLIIFLLFTMSHLLICGESTVDVLSSLAEPTLQEQKKVELVVFAAASMSEVLEEIAILYQQKEPMSEIFFNFDSSGTLKTQIQEGADCDLFISAGQIQMNQLDIMAPEELNYERLDFVENTTRTDILENRVTLVVPHGNPSGIFSFDDMAKALSRGEILMAMGNSDVPVGQYTQRILNYFQLNEEELMAWGCITYGTNVKEVTTQIAESSVACGVIYCTDAFHANLDIVDYATADMCGRVVYPAAVLKTSSNPEAAKAFLDYLKSSEAMDIFKRAGFLEWNAVR